MILAAKRPAGLTRRKVIVSAYGTLGAVSPLDRRQQADSSPLRGSIHKARGRDPWTD